MIFLASSSRDGAASRSRIMEVILADPGIHVAMLAEQTGLSWHTTMYHLRLLERRRLVQLDKGGRERRAFPAGVPPVHRNWLAALRLGEATEVLRLLLQEPRQTIPSLSRRMGYSEKVVRRQVANLAEAGLIQRRGQMRPVYELSRAAEPELSEWLRSTAPQTELPTGEPGLEERGPRQS